METFGIKVDLSKYQTPNKAQEWGDFLVFFSDELNAEIDKRPFYIDKTGKKKKLTRWTPSRVGLKIQHLKRGDDMSAIYHLKSICSQEKARGGSFGWVFNGALKVHAD